MGTLLAVILAVILTCTSSLILHTRECNMLYERANARAVSSYIRALSYNILHMRVCNMRELVHVKITAKMTANRVPIWYVMKDETARASANIGERMRGHSR